MARPRNEAKGDWYAWSDIYNGGETSERPGPGGQMRTIVSSRNIIPRGEKVTKAGLKVDDDTWDALVDGGSVRQYPVPDDADEYVSPHNAVLAQLVDDDGEINVDKLIQMGQPSVAAMSTLPPPINPPAEEGKTLGEDKPAGA